MPRAGKRRPLSVGVVGAGVGGIAVAAKLHRAGFHDVKVFEKSDGPGGTWYDNVYPGCAVDVPSEVYSFSFVRYPWTRTHGFRAELQQYCEHVIDAEGIRPMFHFGQGVESAVWQADEARYVIRLSGGEETAVDLLVSSVGMLNDPQYPSWPGMDEFEGDLVHTARWPRDLDVTGKTVAVVGTGSSAVQLVPAIADQVESLYIFQRQPGWIAPKNERDFTAAELRDTWLNRIKRKRSRYQGFVQHAESVSSRSAGSKENLELTRICLDFIETEIEDPEIRRAVTPDYALGCKRIVRDSNFYQTLNRDNVHLVPRAVERLTASGVVDVAGAERAVDVVVMATGFKANDFLSSLRVVGPAGVSLHEHWAGEPKAFMGLSVPGFPNFFMTYGPNTNGGGSIMAQSERQAEVVVRVAQKMSRRGYRTVDTKQASLDSFVRWVDDENEVKWSSIRTGCTNYYTSPSGRNVTQWPSGQWSYLTRSKMWTPLALKYGS